MKKLIAVLVCLMVSSAFCTTIDVRKSTQKEYTIGSLVAVADGFTPVTDFDPTTSDEFNILKANGAAAVDANDATFTDVVDCNGLYDITLTTGHTDTLGQLTLWIRDNSEILPLKVNMRVLTANVWDTLYSTDKFAVDVNEWTLDPHTVATQFSDALTSTTTAEAIWDATAASYVDAGSMGKAVADVLVDTAAQDTAGEWTTLGDALTTAIGFATPTNITAGTITTVTTVTGGATSAEVAKIPKSDGTATWNATALAAIVTQTASAVAADPNIALILADTGELQALIDVNDNLPVIVKDISDGAGLVELEDFFGTDSGDTYAGAVAGSVVKEIADNAAVSALTEAGITDAVWDEVIVGAHDGANAAGALLDTPGDWVTATGFATPTNITAGTITTASNVTLVSANGITATSIANAAIDIATYAADANIPKLVWDDPNAASGGDATEAKQDIVIAAVKTNAAGTDVAADIIAVKAVVDAVLTDTETTLPTTLTSMSGATFNTATHSLEAIRNRGDAAWITGGGGAASIAILSTTVVSATDAYEFVLTAVGVASDNVYRGLTITVTDADGDAVEEPAAIRKWTASTKTILLEDGLSFTPAAGDVVNIYPTSVLIYTIYKDVSNAF